MPRAIQRKRKPPEDLPDEFAEGPGLDQPGSEAWRSAFDPMDPNLALFDALNCMTARDWLRHVLYLYRIVPEIRNKEGQDKYIARITDPTSEDINGEWLEWVAREHGGGKYYFLLKDDLKPTPRTRTHKFSIDGAPRFQPGQTLAPEQGPALLPPAPLNAQLIPPSNGGGGSDMREVTSLLRDVVKNRPGDMGVEQAVDLMGKVQEASVKVMQRAAEFQVTSSSGSAMVDRLLEKMLEQNLGPKSQPAMDPRLEKILDLAIERVANPEPPARGATIGDLNSVKDLFGVDSIADVFHRFAGGADDGAWKAKLVDAGISLVTMLPQLFAMIGAQRERAFQQSIYLEQLRRGQPAAPAPSHPAVIPFARPAQPPPPPPPPPPAAADTSPIAPGAPVMPFPVFDPGRAALDAIVDYFDEGVDGATAARLVQKHFAPIVAALKPLLADANAVKEFAARTPPLSEISGDPEFPQFLKEFCDEVLHPPQQGEDGAPPEPAA